MVTRVTIPAVLLTERLRLVRWDESHTQLLVDLASRPEVMRYIGDGSTWTRERADEVAARTREHWRRHGFGWRAAIEGEAGTAIGFAALNFAGEKAGVDPNEFEIGWWLAPEMQGRGLAREAAAAVRDEAFNRLRAPSVVARIQPANAASLAVARAIGLRHETMSAAPDGTPIAVLRLTAELDPGEARALPRRAVARTSTRVRKF